MILLVNTKGLVQKVDLHTDRKRTVRGLISQWSNFWNWKRAGRSSSSDHLAWSDIIRHEENSGKRAEEDNYQKRDGKGGITTASTDKKMMIRMYNMPINLTT